MRSRVTKKRLSGRIRASFAPLNEKMGGSRNEPFDALLQVNFKSENPETESFEIQKI